MRKGGSLSVRGFISSLFVLLIFLTSSHSIIVEQNITTTTDIIPNNNGDGITLYEYLLAYPQLFQGVSLLSTVCRTSGDAGGACTPTLNIDLDLDGSSDYFLFRYISGALSTSNYLRYYFHSDETSSYPILLRINLAADRNTNSYLPTASYPPQNCPSFEVTPIDIDNVTTIWTPMKNLSLLEANYSSIATGKIFMNTLGTKTVDADGKTPYYIIQALPTNLSSQSINLNETSYEINSGYLNYTRKIYQIQTTNNIKSRKYVQNVTYCYLGYCNYFKGAFGGYEETVNIYNITSLVNYQSASDPFYREVKCGLTLPINNRRIDEFSLDSSPFDYIMEVEDPRFIANYSDYEAVFGKSFTTLAYVLTDSYSAGYPNYGITVEVQNENGINRYLITSGLEQSEGFYTDFNLRHYLDCNIYDGKTDDVIPLFFSLDGGYVWVDVATACTNKFGAAGGGGPTINESAQQEVIQGIMCGDNKLVKVDNYTIRAEINSNNSITFWWKYLNGSTGQVATTGVANYTVGNSTDPVIQGKIFCDGNLINVLSMDVSDDYIRSDKGVVFVLMFIVFAGLMFLTRSITLNVAVTVFIIIAFWLLKFIKLDVAFIMGMTIVGLAIIALARWGEKG